MTRDSIALTIGQNETALLEGFLGRRDDASPIHQRPPCARSNQSGMALGEITAHFVATIRRSI
jgi:hypothetical protein